MDCRGLSVIRGTAPSEFRVDVIDVIRGPSIGTSSYLLIRASGPAVDTTGIGPGFSGSPVYCRDSAGVERVAGAISQSVGQYGNFVALATPIEAMLGLDPTPTPPPSARKASALLRKAKPIATPLTVSGLSGPVQRALVRAAARSGKPVLAAPAGPALSYAPYPLDPGTSVAAGLTSGDISISAIGTVTYRDGNDLWAFGHLLEGFGRRSLPLLDAYVFSIIDNPLGTFEASTYKLASAGRPVGTLTNDGVAAVAGQVGATPQTIPLTVAVRDETSHRLQTLRMEVSDERQLDLGTGLDYAGSIATMEAIQSAMHALPPRATSRACVRIDIRQRAKPLGYCKRYFGTLEPLGDLSSAFSLVDGYKYGPLDVEGVRVRIRMSAGVRESLVLDGSAPRRVKPGQRIRVRLKLQRSREAGRQRLSFRYRVPRSVRPGARVLTVHGADASFETDPAEALFEELFFFEEFGGPAPPRTVKRLAARIAALGKPDGIRASFNRKRLGPVVYPYERQLVKGQAKIPMIVKGRKDKR
jgi:hypothetical protein